MSRPIVTPFARQNLVDIITYISNESPSAALNVRLRMEDAFSRINDNPGIGHYREDVLDRRHRFYALFSYLIIYRWESRPIEIIAIIHGARDLPALMDEIPGLQ